MHSQFVIVLKLVALAEILLSSLDICRVWHRNSGHFIGFFSQPRLWHLPSAKSVPSTPVRPYDISEVRLHCEIEPKF